MPEHDGRPLVAVGEWLVDRDEVELAITILIGWLAILVAGAGPCAVLLIFRTIEWVAMGRQWGAAALIPLTVAAVACALAPFAVTTVDIFLTDARHALGMSILELRRIIWMASLAAMCVGVSVGCWLILAPLFGVL